MAAKARKERSKKRPTLGQGATLDTRERPRTQRRRTERQERKEIDNKTNAGFMGMFWEIGSVEDILEAGMRLGAIKRQRKVDLPALVQATVAAMSPVPGAETSAMVNYLAITGVPLVPSSFYDRFSEPFAELMRELAGRAIRAVNEAAPAGRGIGEFGVLLERFRDIRLADSTCQVLKKLAKGWAPSTSKLRPASFKLHAVISLPSGIPVAAEVTGQRLHDNAAFPEWTLEPGTLSLFDLGYIDVDRFITATEKGAFFLTRLKSNHNPEIDRVHVGLGPRRAMRGMKLDEAFALGHLDPDHGVIDLDVRIQSKDRSATVRLVAIEDEETDERHWYITNVDRDTLSPHDVATCYRLRWEVELFFKQLKSGAGLHTILAWRTSAVLAFVYAKLVGICLARLLELAVEERTGGGHATGQLALMLTLSRSMPLLLGYFMRQRGVTLAQFEERIVMIATIVARSRNQRRDRVKRNREAAIGKGAG